MDKKKLKSKHAISWGSISNSETIGESEYKFIEHKNLCDSVHSSL